MNNFELPCAYTVMIYDNVGLAVMAFIYTSLYVPKPELG